MGVWEIGSKQGIRRQDAVDVYHDPYVSMGYPPQPYYQPRPPYPTRGEVSAQEVPTGHEYCASDPHQWTQSHVAEWLTWTANEFSLKDLEFHKFCMNGAMLCALGKERFLELAPDFVGDILWEHLEMLQKGYGIEHAQCVPPSEYSEPGFITESYQTLHPISSEELLSLKYESDYPSVILRDAPLNPLQGDYFSVKQEVISPDNMCVGRISRGKLAGQDSLESIESFDSCDHLTQSWSSQSSFSSLQRVPSYDSFDSEDYPSAVHGHKPKGTFKDYVRERADLNKDKPVIPAAALAGYTGTDTTRGGCTILGFS
ncbi:UNVERIFIED_CONTAM: hypothetical protein FKN15_033019 [Acipenser sinensis]